jgi:ferritin-like metal-binding protein YciE
MPKKKTEILTLRDLLILKLNSLLEIENTLTKALPKMADASTDEELDQAFRNHLAETEDQAKRLEEALTILEEKPKKIGVEAIAGLVDDAQWIIDNVDGPEAKDAGLIAAARYVEHYEMAGYAAAAEWATTLRLDEIEDLLKETMAEEDNANTLLGNLAVSKINDMANDMDEDMNDTDEDNTDEEE